MAREPSTPTAPDVARALASNLFVHCFPLALTDAVRRAHPMGFHQFQLLAPQGAASLGLGDDDPRAVVSTVWVDLTNEPVVLRAPHTQGRYFILTLIDTAARPFANFGSRTGDDAGLDLALVGPNWRGELPSGLRAIRAPSDSIWALSRIYAHSTLDFRQTVAVAKRQCVALLHLEAETSRQAQPQWDPPSLACLRQVAELDPATFFHRLDAYLDRAPHALERALRPHVRELQAELGGPPPPSEWSRDFERALARGFADSLEAIRGQTRGPPAAEPFGWRPVGDVRSAGMSAEARAASAYGEIGAPVRDDLLSLVCDHDASGRPLSGAHCYRIHFGRSALPPAKAFWSLSASSAATHAEQRSVGDRSEMTLNPDGSLDLAVQHAPPELGLIRNWAATPEGGFSLIMRLYWPAAAALSGTWRMPPIERTDPGAAMSPQRGEPRSRFTGDVGGDELRPAQSTGG
ncbi:MAG: DUF1254 domain-containing protein [Phenylobacterium sp.]